MNPTVAPQQQANQPFPANLNPQAAQSQSIKQGALMSFAYSFWKNDPYPLIIVTKVTPGKMIKGVNMHYLTFPYIRNLLSTQCNNPAFSWESIKGQSYIENAFRSYKWGGIRQVKVLDCQFLLSIMGMVRSFDPAEVEIIRRQIQEQIRQQVNPRAYEVTTPTAQPTQPTTAAPTVNQIAPAAPAVQQVPTTPTTPIVGQSPQGS